MDPEMVTSTLQATRTLAHSLFEQSRKSSGSYKLLAGSVKELRNVLEDLEDFFEDSSTPGVQDIKLLDRVTRCRSLLEQLETSLAFSQDGDATESTVADFKTALDSIRNELQLSEDAVSSADIFPHPNLETASGVMAPSASVGSTSASARESSHGLRPSSRTSSHQSLGPLDSAHDGMSNMKGFAPSRGSIADRRPSEDKATYISDAAYLTPVSTNGEDACRTGSSSLGWNSPFQDPMSISIEQASSMILRDDESSTTVPARLRSRTGPVRSTTALSFDHSNTSIPPATTGLGILVHDHDRLHPEAGLKAERSRAHSVSTPPVGPAPVLQGVTSPMSSYVQRPSDGPIASTESLNQIDVGRLSPNFAPRGIAKSSRANSSSSITFSTRSVDEYSTLEEAPRSAKSFREDLTAVLDNAFSDSDDFAAIDDHTERTVSKGQQSTSAASFSPPPARRPPSPPRKRPIPKIPRRSSAYRVMNGEPSSSSSDEEDLYSTSKPASPVTARSPSLQLAGQVSNDLLDDEVPLSEKSNIKDSTSSVSSPRKPRHAEQVLSTRAAYASPIQVVTSGSDGNANTLVRRHSTSTGSPNEARTIAEPDPPSKGGVSAMLERAATTHPQQRPMNGNQDISSSIPPFRSPPIPPRPIFRASSGKEMVLGTGLGPASEKQDLPTAGLIIRAPSGKEMPPEPGLELGEKDPSTDPQVATRSLSVSSKMPNIKKDYKEWYAPGEESEATDWSQLDEERISHIIQFWNSLSWDTVQKYLEDYLTSLIEQDHLALVRRVRHLIGVCLSLKGHWSEAIPCFLSVIRTPIHDIANLDDGDCAAAYWLGDCYSLLNQRKEALLAYCIAERSSPFQDHRSPRLSECIFAEQEAVQLGISKSDFEVLWARESREERQGSILDPRLVSQTAARSLLESGPRRFWVGMPADALHDFNFRLSQSQSRSHAFVSLDRLPRIGKFHNLKISVANFNTHPNAPWPLMYDPFFAMANVRRGRLLTYECDLTAVFNTNSKAKLPRSALGQIDCFMATDLNWLITNIRQSLRTLGMEWSEVANVEGTYFVVRYSFMQSGIATTYYFSITLFKQSFRAIYGVHICPDGMCSARIVRADWEYVKGVHESESKRIKKLVRDLLEASAKRESSSLQPESKGGGKGAVSKSLAAFRQRKRSAEDGARA